jgi:hypothetical protein
LKTAALFLNHFSNKPSAKLINNRKTRGYWIADSHLYFSWLVLGVFFCSAIKVGSEPEDRRFKSSPCYQIKPLKFDSLWDSDFLWCQLPENLASAILGNVGTLISFCLGSEDAEIISNELFPVFTAEHLQNIPAYHTYLKLSIDSTTSEPFSATTLNVPQFERGCQKDRTILQSRQRWCGRQTEVEQKLGKWLTRSA